MLKICAHPGCNKRLPLGTKYCKLHCKPARSPEENRENATKRGYDAKWRKCRKAFLGYHPLCEDCGAYKNIQVHHIKPISEGGERFAEENLVTLCASCHNKRHQKQSVPG